MQLHDFAREILVEAALLAAAHRREHARLGIRSDRLRLIEIDEHCRVLFDGKQHVRKAPKHVRTDGFELEQPGKSDHWQLVDGDGKVVGPEMHEPLDEWALGGQRRVEPRRIHHQIILADRLSEVALRLVRLRIRLLGNGTSRHRRWLRLRLALGAARHLLRGEVIAELLDHLSARRHLRERRWPRLKAFELLKKPTLRIGWRLVVGSGAEAEAVERDGGRKHPRLLSREMVQLS